MPPGPIYNGQGHPQQQHPQYNHAQYQHQHQVQQSQSRAPQPIHPQYAAPYANGAPQYQQVQYSHYPQQPQQPQQQAAYYQSSAPQFQNYNAANFNHGHPQAPATPVQFIDPSYLQRSVAPVQTTYVSPTPAPAPVPVPAPTPRATAVTQPAPTVATPQPSRVAQRPLQTPIARDSSKFDERRPSSQGAMGVSTPKDARRLASSGAVAKSPILPQTPHMETLPLLLSVAEDCFAKANAAAPKVAWSMTGDEHRFTDLKYNSVFLLMRTLFQRNQKAALKSLDGHISDCTTYKHIHWIYAFRFLKAAFYLQAGMPADHHALENLRTITGIASKREDKAVFVIAVLLEGLAHLSALKDDWRARVQACIAQAAKLQLEDAVHLPHLDILLSLLDLSCSLHTRDASMSAQKLVTLQAKLDSLKNSAQWVTMSDEILLPVRRMTNTPSTISNDTRAVVRPGKDNLTDYLVLSTIGKHEIYALAYVFQGMVVLQTATTPRKSTTLWNEANRILEENKLLLSPRSIPEALRQQEWINELVCYTHVLVGLQSATMSDWAGVKKCLEAINEAQPPEGFLDIMILYLDGVLQQGTARLVKALEIWKDPSFDIGRTSTAQPNRSHIETELSILAALNRIWIMHSDEHRDDAEMADLVETLRPLCEDNPDPDIRTAYDIVMSSITISPAHMDVSMQQVKKHMQMALHNAKTTSNVHSLSMGLNIMRCRLFDNVVSEQAVKSAKAGLAQARRSGNLLWMSVAEGMLARSHMVMDQLAESKAAEEAGIRHANEARLRTQVWPPETEGP
ncbi:hypothetical protein OQA88_13598 [Cercophora sp. LCS_1]